MQPLAPQDQRLFIFKSDAVRSISHSKLCRLFSPLPLIDTLAAPSLLIRAVAGVSVVLTASRRVAPRHIVVGNSVVVIVSRTYTIRRLAETAVEASIADFLALARRTGSKVLSGFEFASSEVFFGLDTRDGGGIGQRGGKEEDLNDTGAHIDELDNRSLSGVR